LIKLWFGTVFTLIIGLPVLMWLLHNLIPLAVVVILGIVLYFVVGAMLSGEGENQASGGGSPKSSPPKVAHEPPTPQKAPKVLTHPASARLFIDENAWSGKAVFVEYSHSSPAAICTYDELRKGEVVIYHGGKRWNG
jgi:hypothetical protein